MVTTIGLTKPAPKANAEISAAESQPAQAKAEKPAPKPRKKSAKAVKKDVS